MPPIQMQLAMPTMSLEAKMQQMAQMQLTAAMQQQIERRAADVTEETWRHAAEHCHMAAAAAAAATCRGVGCYQ